MFDGNDLLEVIKKISTEAVDAKKPAGLLFGKVISDSPLKVLVEQKMTLGVEQLVLCRNVTDFKTYISTGNTKNYYFTGNNYDSGTAPVQPTPHVHAIGKIQVTVHNKLKKGEEVLLLRQQGGQKFVIIDRVVKA